MTLTTRRGVIRAMISKASNPPATWTPSIEGPDNNWREQAACAGLAMSEPEKYDRIFFDLGSPGPARQFCNTCPVQQECHQFAEQARVPHGVFGGETGASRRARLGITQFEDQVGITATPTPTPTDDPEDWWWRIA